MIIVMSPGATQEELDKVVELVVDSGLKVHLSEGQCRTIIGVIGSKGMMAELAVEVMPGVEKTVSVTESFKLVSREFRPENTVIDVGGVLVGGEKPGRDGRALRGGKPGATA